MSSSGKFKVVLFDLGGTLVKTPEFSKTYRKILGRYGVKVSSDDVVYAHRAREKEFNVEQMVELGRSFWVKWNSKVLEALGIIGNREFLARKIDELWWENAELDTYPDVVQTLVQLREKGIKVGVVTNALEKDYKQILQRLGLTSYFDVAVGIDTCKRVKPDKAIFLYAVDALNVHPKETIFVGDSIKYDYRGAKKAGLKPLLIHREGKALKNVETITNLAEVLSYF
ncbi:MAG: HAD family hydrolase [Candidatus Bathyarchaeota archaeon]|nr:HAD family hydrolase [Candidatus Bathyarchaeota archaeon]MDH5788813.1 HAD family hydrolase [Candidatus Bathyarchaeota archaeon]